MSVLVLLELEAKEGAADEMIAVLARNLGDTRARRGCESVTRKPFRRPTAILIPLALGLWLGPRGAAPQTDECHDTEDS